ncbi:hypothetical protein OA86_10350 [Kaistella jeonii]|uniref:Uncharacterized protein n=1 Tax=Kaistella jeonii TaxID=266749 RepID=A0A0C1F5E8_9FLAO|nr:hypothetical protein OA86_10350 [Kaistella jeonii]
MRQQENVFPRDRAFHFNLFYFACAFAFQKNKKGFPLQSLVRNSAEIIKLIFYTDKLQLFLMILCDISLFDKCQRILTTIAATLYHQTNNRQNENL